jgi:hypothetical protein
MDRDFGLLPYFPKDSHCTAKHDPVAVIRGTLEPDPSACLEGIGLRTVRDTQP